MTPRSTAYLSPPQSPALIPPLPRADFLIQRRRNLRLCIEFLARSHGQHTQSPSSKCASDSLTTELQLFVCISQYCRISLAVINRFAVVNFIQQPLPKGSTTGAGFSGQSGALDMGQRASTGLTTFNAFWSYIVCLLLFR
jgi:hypothetical protein